MNPCLNSYYTQGIRVRKAPVMTAGLEAGAYLDVVPPNRLSSLSYGPQWPLNFRPQATLPRQIYVYLPVILQIPLPSPPFAELLLTSISQADLLRPRAQMVE